MKQEITATGRTVAAALESAADQLGVPAEKLTYEILAEPKKGFLGFGEAPAKILASYEKTPLDLGVEFLEKLLSDMEIDAKISREEIDGGVRINVVGDDCAILIGHHGETLDQLQYLVNLAANRKEGEEDDREYTRISVDIQGYRAKREETLRALARRMASKVQRTHRSAALEPMSAYERRIIHSEVATIPGVTTASVGAENNRRVVIHPEGEE